MLHSREFFTRSAVYLMAACIVAGLLGGMWVAQAQVGTILDLSSKATAANNDMLLMREEMARVKAEVDSLQDSTRHIAVSLRENKLYLMEGRSAIRVVDIATGTGRKITRFGKSFDFSTPPGLYHVTKKETDPVWIAPDWHWLERGIEVPDTITLRDRMFRGPLGKYRLVLRDGIGIHGTDQPNSIGRYATHGCIRVGAKDLEIVFHAVDSGTRVYIY